MKYIFPLICLLLSQFSLNGQDTTAIKLSEYTVSASIEQMEIRKTARNVSVISAKEIEAAPVKTIDGILQYALNIDVRSRAPMGVQADVSIRGGHYDQTLVLVDGVKMNDPQTGHHTLNLPIPIEMIERIEVLQGGSSRVFGPSAFSGVINIITKKAQANQIQLGASGGEYGSYRVNIGANIATKGQNTMIAAEKIKSDGYATNTAFNRYGVFMKTDFKIKNANLGIQGGWMDNKFGASNFYHPKFYNQYEQVSAKFVVAQWQQDFSPNFSSILRGSWRQHNDMYDFDNYRFNKPSAINFHETAVKDVNWIGKWHNTFGITSFGAEWRREGIVSNRLGDSLKARQAVDNFYGSFYALGKNRDNTSFYVEHLKNWDKLTVVGGTLFNVNSQFKNEWFPGVDASYALTNNYSIYTSVNRSLRFPTFTEMYLNSSTVVANPTVKPEKAWTYEMGVKRFTTHSQATVSVFYRNSETAIDKIKRPEKAIPAIENIENLTVLGLEMAYSLKIAAYFNNQNYWLQRVHFNYAYLWADKKEVGFQSFYTLNYLKHKMSIGANMRLTEKLSLDTWYTFKKREGQFQWDNATAPQNYAAVHLLDARLSYAFKAVRCFVDANNLLNKTYFEHGFVAQPKRWVSGGISCRL